MNIYIRAKQMVYEYELIGVILIMKKITEDILWGKFRHLRHKCPPDITDLVFLEIEKDYIGRYNYLARDNNQETLNKSIFRYIKSYWHLKKIGICKTPKSKLLTEYVELGEKQNGEQNDL